MHAPAIKRPVRVKTAICRGEHERALQPEQAAGGRGGGVGGAACTRLSAVFIQMTTTLQTSAISKKLVAKNIPSMARAFARPSRLWLKVLLFLPNT